MFAISFFSTFSSSGESFSRLYRKLSRPNFLSFYLSSLLPRRESKAFSSGKRKKLWTRVRKLYPQYLTHGKALNLRRTPTNDSPVLGTSRQRRRFLLLPFFSPMIHSGKCKNKGRKQWEKEKAERVMRRRNVSEGGVGGAEKGKRPSFVLSSHPRSVTDMDHLALSRVHPWGQSGFHLSADQRLSVVFVSNAVFWALSQATQSKLPAGLRIMPFNWLSTGFQCPSKLGNHWF